MGGVHRFSAATELLGTTKLHYGLGGGTDVGFRIYQKLITNVSFRH